MIVALALLLAQPAPVTLTIPAPADAVAAERAFAARAQVEGQWTAFRATAASDAIMLAPGPINAHQFLARFTSDPKVAVMWWPARVWTSCDGSMAVTTGPWVRKGGTQVGTFTTVWRREPDGRWRWVYDNGRETPAAIEAPDEPVIQRAACPGEAPPAPNSAIPGTWLQREGRMPGEWGLPVELLSDDPPEEAGRSADETLRWEIHHIPERGPHAYLFKLWQLTARRPAEVPRSVGSKPPSPTGIQLVVVEAHGFTDPVPNKPQ